MVYRQSTSIDNNMNGSGSIIDGYFTPSTYSTDGRYIYEGDTVLNMLDRRVRVLSDSSFRLYSLKIYKNGTLFMDMIPCYRTADGEIGMYDQENDMFYTNQGTGSFIKGPDV